MMCEQGVPLIRQANGGEWWRMAANGGLREKMFLVANGGEWRRMGFPGKKNFLWKNGPGLSRIFDMVAKKLFFF